MTLIQHKLPGPNISSSLMSLYYDWENPNVDMRVKPQKKTSFLSKTISNSTHIG